jgi:signal transduction histidine kinase
MGRVGDLLAVMRRAEPRSAPSGWALALDAAIAVGAAAGALLEVGYRNITVYPKRFPTPPHVDFFTHTAAVHPPLGTLIAAAMTALPLAFRRLYPITVLLVIMVAIVAVRTDYVPPIAFATAVFAAYSAVVHSRYRNLAIAVVLAVALGVTVTFADTLPRFPARFTALFAIIPAAAAGLGIRELRRRLNDTTARLRRATEEHEAQTRLAVEAERARIASELHDVLTHNVSVMVVQAGAARSVLTSSPADAEQALLAVESGGRTAMAELRNLLGLLSPADETDDKLALRPQPGLGELDTLIDRVSAAGLPVQLQVSGTPRPLPPGVDLAAYRVVQEALTNVLRHAGKTTTSVSVEWGDELVIAVSDNGNGSNSNGARAPGRGLLGLRERLSLYGGQLDAGPQPSGGWQVRAVMPTGLPA